MCDHYTNEVNGSAVLTIRWMPPSGTVPLYVCVCVLLWCASSDLFGTAEHKKLFTVVRLLRLCPRPSLPAGASLSARGMYGALNPAELSLNFTEGSDELTTSRRLLRAGKLVASILFIYLFIFC